MKESLDPQKIYEDYTKNILSKAETAKQLIIIIESENNNYLTESCIKLLGKLALPSEEVFKVLDNCLIWGRNFNIKSTAANVLIKIFPERSIEAFMHMAIHYCDPVSLFALYDLVGWSENPLFNGIKEVLFKKIEPRVQERVKEGIIYDEAIMLTLFEKLNPEELRNSDEDPNFGYIPLGHYRVSEDGHIVGLYFGPDSDPGHIPFIPENIYRLKHLEELVIFQCELEIIPESIGKLKSLRVLDLGFNLIVDLPQSIGDLDSLEELRLSNNYIEALPESISSLKSLKKLDLSENDPCLNKLKL